MESFVPAIKQAYHDEIPQGRSIPETLLGVHTNEYERKIQKLLSDEDMNQLIAGYQGSLNEWELGPYDLSGSIQKIRGWSFYLWSKFLKTVDGKHTLQPSIFFRFHMSRSRVMGHCVRGRDDAGFLWEISINPIYLFPMSEMEVAAVTLREMVHLLEGIIRTPPISQNNYHSSWFRQLVSDCGIPCTKYGGALGIVALSPFMEWVKVSNLNSKQTMMRVLKNKFPLPMRSQSRKRSKRKVWICSCSPENLVSVLVPRGSSLNAVCQKCKKHTFLAWMSDEGG